MQPPPVNTANSETSAETGSDCNAQSLLHRARLAQKNWSARPLRSRLEILRRIRHQIPERADTLIRAVHLPYRTSAHETLTAEIIPLADACRYLEQRAASLLAPRRESRRGRPFWMWGIDVETHREPFGVVLILGPSNYPLFLPGVQTLQALMAGNAVLLKPGRDGKESAQQLIEMCVAAGLDPTLVQVLPERIGPTHAILQAGVDKVVLTGSAATGRALLAELAESLTPSTMELAGCDAVFVLPDADLDLVTRALTFGLRFNGSATCIAPRRVFLRRDRAPALEVRLRQTVQTLPSIPVGSELATRLRSLVGDALRDGARMVAGELPSGERMPPIVLADVRPEMALTKADLMAPLLSLIPVASGEDALIANHYCPYALGAAIFGPDKEANDLARRVDAGCVVINDVIAPTADPRVSFGGRHASGFGVTRGPDGLLEMTRPKTIVVRRNRWHPHWEPMPPESRDVCHAYLDWQHSRGLARRMAAFWKLIVTAFRFRQVVSSTKIPR